MLKTRFTRKSKSIKETLNYEQIPEDKKRRKAIPESDYGQAIADNNRIGRVRTVLAGQFRQSIKTYKLVNRKLKENNMVVAFIGLLMGVWLSGFFAHAGMRFESLLAGVLGVVFLVVVGLIGTKK